MAIRFPLQKATEKIVQRVMNEGISINSYTNTSDFNNAIQNESIKNGDIVYVQDENVIVYINEDALSTLKYIYPENIEPFISLALLFKLLNDHIENDKGYWQTQQQNSTNIYSLQQMLLELQKRIVVLENQASIPAEPTPLDMSNGTVLHSPPLIGLLGIEIGGIDLVSPLTGGWNCPSNGGIVFSDGGLITLLSPEYIEINGVKAAPTGSLVVIKLIGNGDGGEIRVNAGDNIVASGIGNISFYPELS